MGDHGRERVRVRTALTQDVLIERRLSPELVFVVGLATSLALLGMFVWLGSEMREGETLRFDASLRSAIYSLASPPLTKLMIAASRYGGPRYLVPLTLVMGLGFVLRGWRRGGLLVVVTLAGAAILDFTLKAFFQRVRPDPFFNYPLPDSPSFPSGHALFAMCILGGLAALSSVRLRHSVTRLVVWVVALPLIALIGLSRVYLGVHYPTDVFAGYMVGLVWVVTVALGDWLARRSIRRR